jgi:hypothetical protein
MNKPYTITSMATEDLDYGYSEVAVKNDVTRDVDYNNKSVLIDVLEEIDRLIAHHNSKDSLDLRSKDATLREQVLADRRQVGYLRGFRDYIANKVEELTNGR